MRILSVLVTRDCSSLYSLRDRILVSSIDIAMFTTNDLNQVDKLQRCSKKLHNRKKNPLISLHISNKTKSISVPSYKYQNRLKKATYGTKTSVYFIASAVVISFFKTTAKLSKA